jgi:hypothetical protein
MTEKVHFDFNEFPYKLLYPNLFLLSVTVTYIKITTLSSATGVCLFIVGHFACGLQCSCTCSMCTDMKRIKSKRDENVGIV